MTGSDLPEEVRAFVARTITSVEQLEVLFLLRARRELWTPEQVSAELRTAPASAAARLADLERQSLVCTDGCNYWYEPPAPVGAVVDAVAAAYATHRYRIIELIFAKPIDNIRVFASAFRLRKDEDDG